MCFRKWNFIVLCANKIIYIPNEKYFITQLYMYFIALGGLRNKKNAVLHLDVLRGVNRIVKFSRLPT